VSRRLRLTVFVVAGLVLAAALAFFVSPHASGEPDGLNRVAIDEGFADEETNHALADTPTAGYAVDGVDDDGLSTGLAGLIGVAVTFAVAGALFLVVRRTGGSSRAGRRAAE
jgi:PDGLE domain-containing protein